MTTPTYSIFELPLTPHPQYLTVRLVGVHYRLKLAWNIPAHCWVLDWATIEGVPILNGMAIVTGSDLLAQYEYLGIRGQLLAITDQTRGDLPPTYEGLGLTGHVYFLPDDAQPL